MRERFVVTLESRDPALSVVALRRALKHLWRSYGLRAVSCRRENPAPTSNRQSPGRRKLARRASLVTFPLPHPRGAPPGGRLRETGGFLTQRSEPGKEDS